MGTDKSFAVLNNKPIFEHVLARLKQLDLPIIVITNNVDKYAPYALPMASDVLPNQGALGGLYTAIHTSPTDYTLCVACDMPFLNTALLQKLIDLCDGWDVTVPRIGDFPETMHAVYCKSCLEPIRSHLAKGKLKASGFYEQVNVRYIEEAVIRLLDPELRSFVNVNTPDDLAAANQEPQRRPTL